MRKLIVTSLLLVGCSQHEATIQIDSAQRGKITYTSTCATCHNINPALEGSIGPKLKGSSFDLIKQKVTLGTYPDGYTPKRGTHVMPKMPYLDTEIMSLYLYLGE